MKSTRTLGRFAIAALLGVSAPAACSAAGTSSDRGGNGASIGSGASSASGGSSGSASGGFNAGGSSGAGVGGSAGAAGTGAGGSGVGGSGFGGDVGVGGTGAGPNTGGTSGTGTSSGGAGGCDPRERPCDAGTDAPPPGCGPGMTCRPGAIRYCDSGGFEFQKSTCEANGNWGPCLATAPPPGWCEPPGGFSPELCCPPLQLCCQDESGGPFVDFGSGACAATMCP